MIMPRAVRRFAGHSPRSPGSQHVEHRQAHSILAQTVRRARRYKQSRRAGDVSRLLGAWAGASEGYPQPWMPRRRSAARRRDRMEQRWRLHPARLSWVDTAQMNSSTLAASIANLHLPSNRDAFDRRLLKSICFETQPIHLRDTLNVQKPPIERIAIDGRCRFADRGAKRGTVQFAPCPTHDQPPPDADAIAARIRSRLRRRRAAPRPPRLRIPLRCPSPKPPSRRPHDHPLAFDCFVTAARVQSGRRML